MFNGGVPRGSAEDIGGVCGNDDLLWWDEPRFEFFEDDLLTVTCDPNTPDTPALEPRLVVKDSAIPGSLNLDQLNVLFSRANAKNKMIEFWSEKRRHARCGTFEGERKFFLPTEWRWRSGSQRLIW